MNDSQKNINERTRKSRAWASAFYYRNREAILAKLKKKRAENHDQFLERDRAYRKKHREVLLQRKCERRALPEEKEKAHKYYKKHPEITRRFWLRSRYGLTLEKYNTLLASQGGVCAICGNSNNHPTRWGKNTNTLSVDHCHRTKKVRGLLCNKCNSGIGYFCESIPSLMAAVDYLNLHNPKP